MSTNNLENEYSSEEAGSEPDTTQGDIVQPVASTSQTVNNNIRKRKVAVDNDGGEAKKPSYNRGRGRRPKMATSQQANQNGDESDDEEQVFFYRFPTIDKEDVVVKQKIQLGQDAKGNEIYTHFLFNSGHGIVSVYIKKI